MGGGGGEGGGGGGEGGGTTAEHGGGGYLDNVSFTAHNRGKCGLKRWKMKKKSNIQGGLKR